MNDGVSSLRLVLLWHFHQPEYTDPVTRAPSMPWTRLHALKDYADMAARLERHPGVRATVNVVPSLLDQLKELAREGARPDPFLALARRAPAELTEEERRSVVTHFFSLNLETMGRGLPRLRELAALRGAYDREELPASVVARFDDAALRDLQVLFHLAWSGPLLRSDPRVTRLLSKGRSFTEEEKRELLGAQDEFLRGVLPRFRRLAGSGQVELSVSPYYHPILPLLCDLRSALEALPGLRLPSVPFEHPEDAAIQLREAMKAFEAALGRPPCGGWPSEGAISERALEEMARAGFRWAASDEDVLFASLEASFSPDRAAAERDRADLLYRPWRRAESPALLFRDRDLSDRIGFVYSAWPAAAAADDFLRRLRHLHEVLPPGEGPYTVSVILDGENAWEYYPDHAEPFFEALYGALEQDPTIETLTATEAVETSPARELPRVVAGSWIGRNLATWIGHPEKNRAWELLAATREAVASARGEPRFDDAAWRAVFAAEGSDWFWWFGDDHPTAFGQEFDAGFRAWLRAAWREAGLSPPAALDDPIRRRAGPRFTSPSGPVRPTLDGRVTDYFEWLAAGQATSASGAMQASSSLLRRVWYGTDGKSLYLRLDPTRSPASVSLAGTILTIRVPEMPERTLKAPVPQHGEAADGPVRMVVDQVLEAEVPLDALAEASDVVRFQVEIETREGATQRVPAEGALILSPMRQDASRFDWFV